MATTLVFIAGLNLFFYIGKKLDFINPDARVFHPLEWLKYPSWMPNKKAWLEFLAKKWDDELNETLNPFDILKENPFREVLNEIEIAKNPEIKLKLEIEEAAKLAEEQKKKELEEQEKIENKRFFYDNAPTGKLVSQEWYIDNSLCLIDEELRCFILSDGEYVNKTEYFTFYYARFRKLPSKSDYLDNISKYCYNQFISIGSLERLEKNNNSIFMFENHMKQMRILSGRYSE